MRGCSPACAAHAACVSDDRAAAGLGAVTAPGAQFYSDLSLLDPTTGDELLRKTISVNDPFRYGVSPTCSGRVGWV
jgi:hypothetical protein